MNESYPQDPDVLSLSQAKRIDKLCDRFEAVWKAGQRPSIEEYLKDIKDPEHAVLLQELILLEMEYRRSRGEDLHLSEYRHRFSEHASLIDDLFTSEAVAGNSGGALTECEGAWDMDNTSSVDRVEARSKRASEEDPDAPLSFQDFEMIKRLGETAMSAVWEAEQKSLRRRVALKILRKARTVRRGAVDRFLREAQALAQLRHPGIVDVYGIGRMDDGGYFLAMDLIRGIDLEERITRSAVSMEEAASIVSTIAEAVQHAHERGIIHRDLKPSNVLIEEGKGPLLTDFGLAKHLQGEGAKISQSGDIVGTPSYMAPEQARKGEPVDERTDVYGLGGILYALLTGQPPFPGGTFAEVIGHLLTEDRPVLPRLLRAEVPDDLEEICMRCLDKNPHVRYATAHDVTQSLRAWRTKGVVDQHVQESSGLENKIPRVFTHFSPETADRFGGEAVAEQVTSSLLFLELGSVSFKASLVPKCSNNRIVPRAKYPEKKLKNFLGLRVYRENYLNTEIIADARLWFDRRCRWAKEWIPPADEVLVVATAAFRDMELFEGLEKCVHEIFGTSIHVLDGLLEAQLLIGSYKRTIKDDTPTMLFDLGGGSLEVVCLEKVSTHFTSLQLGAGRVTAWIMDGCPLKEIRDRIEHEFLAKCQTIKELSTNPWHGTGGAVKSYSKITLGPDSNQPIWQHQIHQEFNRLKQLLFDGKGRLKQEAIEDGYKKMIEAAPIDLPSHRRRIYIGGILIMDSLCKHFRISSIKLDTASVRGGVLEFLKHLRPEPLL